MHCSPAVMVVWYGYLKCNIFYAQYHIACSEPTQPELLLVIPVLHCDPASAQQAALQRHSGTANHHGNNACHAHPVPSMKLPLNLCRNQAQLSAAGVLTKLRFSFDSRL